MLELKKEVIKYAQKLNSTNLSPLRSGNVSVRVIKDNGFRKKKSMFDVKPRPGCIWNKFKTGF